MGGRERQHHAYSRRKGADENEKKKEKKQERTVSFSQSACSTVHPQPQLQDERHFSAVNMSIHVRKAVLMKEEYLEL